MKKKIIYSVIAILLIVFVLFSYMQLNGNPIDKNKAKESLEEFLEQTYPDMDYKIKRSVGYGWTDGTFHFKVMKKDPSVETTYRFYVSALEPYEVYSDTIHESNIDKEASKKLNVEAQQYILALLQEKVPQVNSVATDVEVYNNDAEEWTPQLKTPKPILIMLEIEKGDLTKEQMLQQSQEIQKQLNSESIDYYLAEVGYLSIINGEENYEYVSFTPEQELTIKDVD
ncbi:DUF3139 domain-containing protein [Fredinandcohnia quinoae]|uniref:DUF3139 domain-containing protein n=1 Tax=Fredinandcohnia quinoae TaxID=2918902 RepID=A0AAW5EBV7_9BACI|nr:DUF3139 domain-containing protein [Fredinandcohnia sp. SECRCQ15]MCH1627462.1 DUF3139 domain-containing protein [Fredinandcohnia sp. SECRCQ15]